MSGATLRKAVRTIQRSVPQARRGVTVLAYHLVNGGTDSPVDISEQAFIDQLEWLGAHAHVVSLLDADPAGPATQVALTFDDAYQNFYDVVWPLLQEAQLPATLYVPVDYIDGGATPIRNTTLPPATWGQLREMAALGLEIGSHTLSHADLRTLSGAPLRREIDDSKVTLEDRVGKSVQSFCYPRGLHSAESRVAVAETYRLGVIGSGRTFTPRTPRARVPRVPIRRDHDTACLEAMMRRRVWLEEFASDILRQHRS